MSGKILQNNYAKHNLIQTRSEEGKTYVVGRNGGKVTGKEVLFSDDGAMVGTSLANVPPVKMGRSQAMVYAVQDKILNAKNTASVLKPIFKLAVAAAAGYGVWGLAHVLFGTVMHLNPHLTLGLSIAAVALIPATFALLAFMTAKGKYEKNKSAALKQDAAYEARKAVENANRIAQNDFNPAFPPHLA